MWVLRSLGAALGLFLLPALALADAIALLPAAPSALSPLVREGAMERYSPDSLWEKIDGEAELYRRFGLRDAAFAYFKHPRDPDVALEISAFRMDSVLGAFGVWATFRHPDDETEPLGNGAFRDEYQAALWHGTVFLVLHAYGGEGERRLWLDRGLTVLQEGLGPAPGRPALLSALEALCAPSSVRFLPDHLLGRTVLPPGLEGRTKEGLGVFAGVEGAGGPSAADAYRRLLQGAQPVKVAGALGWSGVDPDLGPVTVLVAGERVVGVRAGAAAPGTTELLERLAALPAP